MSDVAATGGPGRARDPATRNRRRYAAERRFRLYGLLSVAVAVAALLALLGSMVARGWSALHQTYVTLEVTVDAETVAPAGRSDAKTLADADYTALVRGALYGLFPEVRARGDRRALAALLSQGAADGLRARVIDNPALIGRTLKIAVLASDEVDQIVKGRAGAGKLNERQHGWLEKLKASGHIGKRLNVPFFTHGDSREPELAGIRGAMMGSFLTMLVTLALSFPLGVATAVYLEEFAPKNRWTDLIEVNINNLAAVPSIIFGLLGLAVFLNFFGLPRSAPLVGGIVLALMTLPTIIIAARAALLAVPGSIRQAALGVGASPMQVVTHHVLPLAFPGILTGTIIGAARALGETAPLLMIGMVAFIVDVPQGLTDPATVLPVQIYLWSDSPERAFVERTAAATLVLLAFLIVMNFLAVILRKKFERRW
jgi:phosphate transport system permease protein